MSFAKKRLQAGFVAPSLPMLILLAILAAIPLTVFIAQKQQEIRQRAEENPVCTNNNIKQCSQGFLSNSCTLQGARCKDNNIVYECEEEKTTNAGK